MTVVFPDGVQAEGNVKVAFVPAIADTASPKLTELDAAESVDLSCYITAGQFQPTAEQNTGDDRRLCSKETFQVLGRVTRGFEDVTYIYDPQGVAGAEGNAAYEALKQGTTGFLVARYGLDAQDSDFAVGQVVDIYPVECGAQRKTAPPENDEFAKLTVTQRFGVTGPMSEDAAIVAGP